jgi:uncharacterized tellurite resistance protein B-like protein
MAKTGAARKTGRRAKAPRPELTLDEAVIALLVGAMEANAHTARDEAARAHHLIWSTKRYRRKSGEAVGRLLETARRLVGEHGALAVVAAASREIPARLRRPVFALAADLVLADGKIEPAERRFLDRLAADLLIEPAPGAAILDAMLVKNSL